jgi:hypothetical protein
MYFNTFFQVTFQNNFLSFTVRLNTIIDTIFNDLNTLENSYLSYLVYLII